MNKNDCISIFGAANVKTVKTFKIDGGRADFGDEPHLGGAPQGTAVVCWLAGGKVAVLGKLYCDVYQRSQDVAIARIEIRFRRQAGQSTGQVIMNGSVHNNNYWVASKSIAMSPPPGTFNQVRIRLKFEQPNTQLGVHVVGEKTFNRP